MISSADFNWSPPRDCVRLAPRSPPEEGASTREPGEERSRSCRADPMAASVQFCWPSAFRNLAVCVQDLVAADRNESGTFRGRQRSWVGVDQRRRTAP
jgi:hypothetical protein